MGSVRSGLATRGALPLSRESHPALTASLEKTVPETAGFATDKIDRAGAGRSEPRATLGFLKGRAAEAARALCSRGFHGPQRHPGKGRYRARPLVMETTCLLRSGSSRVRDHAGARHLHEAHRPLLRGRGGE